MLPVLHGQSVSPQRQVGSVLLHRGASPPHHPDFDLYSTEPQTSYPGPPPTVTQHGLTGPFRSGAGLRYQNFKGSRP